MKSKLVTALCLALVGALLLTTVAAAEQGGGTGTLVAKGDGLAVVKGDVSVSIKGSGMLLYRDWAGDAKVTVSGKGVKKELPNGWTVYIGFDGHAQINGSNVVVALRGVNIHLEATGTGRFLLRGQGTYHTNKGDGEWTEAGVALALP